MAKVTIKDVAKEAGVSISTVSNALNDVDVLNADTKARVLEVAKRLKYIPNLNGKNLKAKKSNTIGFYTPSLEGDFYGMLADAMCKACEARDYELVIHVTKNKKRVLRGILGHNEDGVIVIYVDQEKELEESIEEHGITAVYLDREACSERSSSVTFDSYNAGRQAVKCLVSGGKKRIGYIRGIRNSYDDNERSRGFFDEVNACDVVFDADAELEGNFNDNDAYKAVTEYLNNTDNPVEGFFAANDTSAIGCVNAILDAGLKVPEDIAVVGCDGIEVGRLIKPAITTVVNPIRDQARAAVELLIDLIDGTETGKIVKLPVKLEVRESAVITD